MDAVEFVGGANEVRLQVAVLNYNLGNLDGAEPLLPPRMIAPDRSEVSSHCGFLVITGARFETHARY